MNGRILEGWTDKEIKDAIRKAFGDVTITPGNVVKLLKRVFDKLKDTESK